MSPSSSLPGNCPGLSSLELSGLNTYGTRQCLADGNGNQERWWGKSPTWGVYNLNCESVKLPKLKPLVYQYTHNGSALREQVPAMAQYPRE